MNPPDDGQRPEIEYPCEWSYRVIGTAEAAIRALVAEIAGDAAHALETSNVSSQGTYVSVRLTVLVVDEDHRLAIFHSLRDAECVKMVL
jgi:putative lipoic acid-binding regulatory protein